jgi:hypothetical protein
MHKHKGTRVVIFLHRDFPSLAFIPQRQIISNSMIDYVHFCVFFFYSSSASDTTFCSYLHEYLSLCDSSTFLAYWREWNKGGDAGPTDLLATHFAAIHLIFTKERVRMALDTFGLLIMVKTKGDVKTHANFC